MKMIKFTRYVVLGAALVGCHRMRRRKIVNY